MSRDHKLELALKRELRAAGTPDPDNCVDAEMLGAWSEGGLDPAQMAAVELHVSSCGRCQAIVEVTARSAPVIAPLANEGWFRFPRWVLVPMAAAATITIWMVVPQDTMPAPTSPASVPTLADAPSNDAPQVVVDSVETQRLAARAEEPSAAEPQRADAAPPALQDRAQRTDDRRAALGAAAASPPPAAPLAEATLQKSANLAATSLEIVSPDASRRWRVVNGAIERSDDSGASWVATRALSGQTITGGSAPTGSVCWLIGSAGMVMIAVDGITFREVPLPESIDVTAITAADARSATVTTADGRRFRTDDSGRTWRHN